MPFGQLAEEGRELCQTLAIASAAKKPQVLEDEIRLPRWRRRDLGRGIELAARSARKKAVDVKRS
jgi:hypothetical protein